MIKQVPGRWVAIAILPIIPLVLLLRHRSEDGGGTLEAREARPHKPAPVPTIPRRESIFERESRLNRIPLEAGSKRFLADRGRSAENLAVAFMMCRDDGAYLEEALAKDPNSVVALYARICAKNLSPRPDLVQRLRRLDPENPLWCVAEAALSVQTDDKPAAIAALRTALTLDEVHDPFAFFIAAEEQFRRDYLHESYRESLVAVRPTRLLNGNARLMSLHQDFEHVYRYLRSALYEARDLGLAEEAKEFLGLALGIAQLQARQSSLDAIRQSALTEDQFLPSSRREVWVDELLDRPRNQYRQETIADVRLAGKLGSFCTDFIETASEAELTRYVEERNRIGEVAALQALLSKSGATVLSE